MNILKKLFSNTKDIRQSISVIKYPDRIFFETYDQIINAYSTRSKEITILNSNSSNIEIGKAILKHLSLSRTIKKLSDETRKENYEIYKKITGLKSMKAQMKDSLCVNIYRENNTIEFSPTVNGGTTGDRKGYNFSDEGKITIENNEDFELIGKSLRLALVKCR